MRPVVAFARRPRDAVAAVADGGRAAMVARRAHRADRRRAPASPPAGRARVALARGRRRAARRVAHRREPRAARTCCARTLVLPAAVEENLRQALAYDLDRHTPFKAEELYFDAVVIDRDAARGTITVDLAAARRTVVDPALRARWRLGRRRGRRRARSRPPTAATVAAQPAAAETAPREAASGGAGSSGCRSRCSSRWRSRPSRSRSGRSASTRWSCCTQADEARARAAVSETLRSELDARVADYNFALERKYAFPGALAGGRHGQQAAARRHLAHAVRAEEPSRRARRRSASCWCAARPPTPAGSCSCSRSRSSSRRPRSAAPTTKIQPGPGEIFDLGAQLKPAASPPERLALAAPAKPRRRRATPRRRPPAAGTRRPRAGHALPRRGRAARAGARRRRRPRRRCARRGRRRPRRACPPPSAPRRARRRPPAPAGPHPRRAGADRRGRTPRRRRRRRPRRAATPVAGMPIRRPGKAMTPEFAARLSPAQAALRSRSALLVAAVLAGARRRCSGPSCCCTVTTTPPSTTSPTASSATGASPRRRPSCAGRSSSCKEKDGRRFYLKNTAPNLASAELADLVRGGDREQRRSHHDQPEPRAARRGPLPAARR